MEMSFRNAGVRGDENVPVRLVQDDELVSASGQRHLLLREALDLPSDDVDTALITGVEFQDGLFVCVPEHLSGETEDRCGLSDTRHPGDDEMRHVPILCDDL